MELSRKAEKLGSPLSNIVDCTSRNPRLSEKVENKSGCRNCRRIGFGKTAGAIGEGQYFYRFSLTGSNELRELFVL